MPNDLTPFEALERAISIAGGQSAAARICGVSQPAVWKWLQSSKRVPAECVLRIEASTGVSRHLLRPDIYPVTLIVDHTDQVLATSHANERPLPSAVQSATNRRRLMKITEVFFNAVRDAESREKRSLCAEPVLCAAPKLSFKKMLGIERPDSGIYALKPTFSGKREQAIRVEAKHLRSFVSQRRFIEPGQSQILIVLDRETVREIVADLESSGQSTDRLFSFMAPVLHRWLARHR